MQQKLIPEAVKDLVQRMHQKVRQSKLVDFRITHKSSPFQTRSRSRSSYSSSSHPSVVSEEESEYYCVSEVNLPRRPRRRNKSASTRSSLSRHSSDSAASESERRGRSVAPVPLATANKPLVPPPVPEKDVAPPSEVDAQIQVAQRRTLSRSPMRGSSPSPGRRHAVYFQSMQPQYDPANKTLIFHDPSAAALALL